MNVRIDAEYGHIHGRVGNPAGIEHVAGLDRFQGRITAPPCHRRHRHVTWNDELGHFDGNVKRDRKALRCHLQRGERLVVGYFERGVVPFQCHLEGGNAILCRRRCCVSHVRSPGTTPQHDNGGHGHTHGYQETASSRSEGHGFLSDGTGARCPGRGRVPVGQSRSRGVVLIVGQVDGHDGNLGQRGTL